MQHRQYRENRDSFFTKQPLVLIRPPLNCWLHSKEEYWPEFPDIQ